MMPAKFVLPRLLVLAGSSLALVLVASFVVWSTGSDQREARKQAESLIAQIVPDGEVTQAEYAVWQQLAGSAELTRLESAKLLQQERYVPLLFQSTELISNAVIGFDYDGAMSRELAEQLICKQLEANPLASAEAASLYLVPWLNQAALASEYCARVLTDSLVIAAPRTFLQRAELLAKVLGRLPTEQAQTYVGEIVNLMNTINTADVDVLFSTMQHLDTAVFSVEFQNATEILRGRIANTRSSADIATLFEAIDYLKYDLSTEQLIPVLDVALGKLLELRDNNLTRSLYFTLLDLKVSHPDTSFGARADYLMRGINIYGTNVEISDYSGVLRLDEQYGSSPGYEPAMAAALLADISGLGEDEYRSSIRSYCLRFLELSPALSYAEFLAGAKLLAEQLHNEDFLFQRLCLHDMRFLSRLDAAARTDITAIVVSALVTTAQSGASGSATRVAEHVELLRLLGPELNAEQTGQVATAIMELVAVETDAYRRNKLGSAAVNSNIGFPVEFYRELFELFSNADALSGASALLLAKLPAEQRTDLVNTALAYFFAETDPAELAAQAEFLVMLEMSMSAEDLQKVVSVLTGVIGNTRDITLIHRLMNVLNNLQPRAYPNLIASLQPRVIELMSASSQRAELLELFAAVRMPQRPAETSAIFEAAVVRMLEQIEPADGLERRVRATMRRAKISLSTASVEKLSVRFIELLANPNADPLLTDYVVSIETLALHARPGELNALLQALRRKLDAVTDSNSHRILLTTWIAVEASTNKDIPQKERLPLYLDLLQLPLNSNDSRSLLVAQLEQITEQNFAGDIWQFTEWMQKASLAAAVLQRR